MSKYYCKCCNYDAKVKGNYIKHLKTFKHKKIEQIQLTQSQKKVDSSKNNENLMFSFNSICKYCHKEFTTKQAMYRHIKYTCSQNSDESIIELCRLLNEKDRRLMEQGNQITALYDKIEKLSNKLQITNINNGIINNNVNIELLNYEQTDYSHLTETDYVTCIRDCNYSVKSLIEKVHFNENKPENMNIYISSIKGKYAMVYKNNKWQIIDRMAQIDDLYDMNEIILSSWYKEYKVKYPEIMQDMKRYLQNIEENDTINEVKKEILLMLYNNRNQVLTIM
uniref:Uncharacterized protein n=1 Tax=viral metagenome TaxID=1070528 RepID=A0A6C0KYX4_9ZZZZ